MAPITAPAEQLSDALLDFALEGRFPDDVTSFPPVSTTDLGPAIEALAKNQKELESEVHIINEETREEVSSWVKNAKTLQEDIIRSKTIANDIVRQSEAPAVSGETIQDAEDKIDFLNREVQYSQQLYGVMVGIRRVNQLLSEVEKASHEGRILDSLHLLEESWSALDNVEVSKTCRVMKQLDLRAFELKSDIHDAFNHLWESLVQADIETGRFTIYNVITEDGMSLADAVIGLKAYKELDERMEQLWRNLDAAIVAPRMDADRATTPTVTVEGDAVKLTGQTDKSVESLLRDLDVVFTFVATKLPPDLLQSLCSFMMNDAVPRLIEQWLNPAVPSSLQGMEDFEHMIQRTKEFSSSLDQRGYTNFGELSEWADKAPNVWLGKCRETALDSVRAKLTKGIGQTTQVEKVEKHMVTIAEGKELATTGAGATADTNDWGDDWGDAWDEDNGANGPKDEASGREAKVTGEDDGADAWGWDEGDNAKGDTHEANKTPEEKEEDETAEAWGWGDEAAEADSPRSPKKQRRQGPEQTRELVLKETYNISSMPEPVLELIFAILEDGAALTTDGDEYAHVAATAPGLFALPTFALALFRAISPHYYSRDVGGNMFLYNDAMYLAEKLSDFSSSWKQREDLTPRAKALLRLDNDVKSLQGFANRSYATEMNVQKTILRDLLGGAQSLLQQDETELAVESGVARIRSMAATWEPILARSVWSQAIGSLADALAAKLITDVLEMSAIGQDEAYSIAKLIATATELDDLFLPSKLGGGAPGEDEVPSTAQYAPSWLRLKYLSEVLQSNLNEVKYLWFDSELSLYFTADEVVDLIRASFEDNPRTRGAVREVEAKPRPLG